MSYLPAFTRRLILLNSCYVSYYHGDAVSTFALWTCLTCSKTVRLFTLLPELSRLLAKGGIDLDKLTTNLTDPRVFAAWTKVFDRVKAGEMPPKSVKARPEKAETEALLKGLENALIVTDHRRVAVAGRAPLRRLNRTEYENTLRDLLNLTGLNVRDLLRDDGRAYGFDKSGAGLEVSSVQLAKYLEAADVALDHAIAKWAERPVAPRVKMYPSDQYDFMVLLTNSDCVFLKDKKFDPRIPLIEEKWNNLSKMIEAGVFKEPSAVGVFRHQDESFQARFSRFSPVHAGRYRIRFSVWSYWWEKGEIKPAPRAGAVGLYYGERLLGILTHPRSHQPFTRSMPGSIRANSSW